jgi:hypothetical protein
MTVDYTPILCLLALVALVVWAVRSYRAFYRAPDTQPRIDRRLSAREMELTGEDYRDHITGYFAKRSGHQEIIRQVTGADTWTP